MGFVDLERDRRFRDLERVLFDLDLRGDRDLRDLDRCRDLERDRRRSVLPSEPEFRRGASADLGGGLSASPSALGFITVEGFMVIETG